MSIDDWLGHMDTDEVLEAVFARCNKREALDF